MYGTLSEMETMDKYIESKTVRYIVPPESVIFMTRRSLYLKDDSIYMGYKIREWVEDWMENRNLRKPETKEFRWFPDYEDLDSYNNWLEMNHEIAFVFPNEDILNEFKEAVFQEKMNTGPYD